MKLLTTSCLVAVLALSGSLSSSARAADIAKFCATPEAGGVSSTGPQAEAARDLWSSWVKLWNGDFGQAGIISPNFRLHAALLDGSSDTAIDDPHTFVRWITQARSPFKTMQFTTVVGPLISGEYVVGRWTATGVYAGGVPGAKADVGTVVMFSGTDILRVRDGLIVEYWVSSDTNSMLSQLKV